MSSPRRIVGLAAPTIVGTAMTIVAMACRQGTQWPLETATDWLVVALFVFGAGFAYCGALLVPAAAVLTGLHIWRHGLQRMSLALVAIVLLGVVASAYILNTVARARAKVTTLVSKTERDLR